jgi:hypothetical protein
MNLPKFARFVGLALIVAVSALPASAARRCSCDYCQTVAPTTPCNFDGQTTCGEFLAVTLCQPVG